MDKPLLYRVSRAETGALWHIEKKHEVEFKTDAIVPIILAKNANFTEDGILCEGVMGFADNMSAADWMMAYTKTQLHKGNEIVFKDDKFHWEGGGPIHFSDVLYATRDGKMFNIVPLGV